MKRNIEWAVPSTRFIMSEMTFTTLRNYPNDRKQTPHHSLRLYDYASPSRIFTPISTLTPHIMFTLTPRSLTSVWNDSEFACMIPGIIGGTLFLFPFLWQYQDILYFFAISFDSFDSFLFLLCSWIFSTFLALVRACWFFQDSACMAFCQDGIDIWTFAFVSFVGRSSCIICGFFGCFEDFRFLV